MTVSEEDNQQSPYSHTSCNLYVYEAFNAHVPRLGSRYLRRRESVFKDIMEEYQGLVQVKTCDTELGAGPVGGANNNNNTKFSRCEGCGELIMDRCSDTFIADN